MLLNTKILPIIIAGLMNGSFIIPIRYIKNLTNEKIWFFHSIIGLAIIPWLILLIYSHAAIHNYLSLPVNILAFLIFSGGVFGLGQVCFAYAIELIGIALSFTINLGIGLIIGSMFVVFYKNSFWSLQGDLVTLSVIAILLSLIIYYCANKTNKIQNDIRCQSKSYYHTGWILAVLTGFTSGLQNIAFVVIAFHSQVLLQANSFWVWPPFLLAASMPMLLGFLYRSKIRKLNNTNAVEIGIILILRNIFLVLLMGLFFTGSLALYSSGMSQLSHQQQIVGWPAFMVSIIFVSQLWGWVYKEANGSTKKSHFYKFVSLLLLVIAIIILAIEI